MAVLDHFIVPSRERDAAARSLAGLLGVSFGESGRFSAVYLNDALTIDFAQKDRFDAHHYCFLVTEEEFDAIVARIEENGIRYRSSPHGLADMKFSTANGGRNLYWAGPDGHNWEILTVSYARPVIGLSASGL